MVSYNQFEDDDDVQMPRRGYLDIVRKDSSVELRNRMRASWAPGENLWGIDFNNNFNMLRWWTPMDVWRYRTPSAPWINNPAGQRVVVRSGMYEDLVGVFSGGSGSYYVPYPGCTLYSKADRLSITYTGTEWKPRFYAYRHRPEIEISLFARDTLKNQVCASHTVSERFQLIRWPDTPFCRWSRFRCSRTQVDVDLLKNGVKFGYATFDTQGATISRVAFNAEVTEFEPGDVISIRTPAHPEPQLKWVSLSLLGKVIQ